MNKTQQKYAPAYEPAYQPPQQTVIVQNVHFGPRPVSKIEQRQKSKILRFSKGQLICPFQMTMICTQCQSQIVTRTESEPSVTAWILGLVLCCM